MNPYILYVYSHLKSVLKIKNFCTLTCTHAQNIPAAFPVVSAVSNTRGQTRKSEWTLIFLHCILYPLPTPFVLPSYLTPGFGLFFEAEADLTGGGFIFGELATGEPTDFLNGELTFPGP
jgi:hypothetical protein